MNRKEEELNRILDNVIACCDMEGRLNGRVVTREKVLSGCKEENCVMTRSLINYAVIRAGYTTQTVSELLGMGKRAVRELMTKDSLYQENSRAYRLAKAEISDYIDDMLEAEGM